MEGLQKKLDALAHFCDLRKLTVNLSKTKATIFNGVKKTSDFCYLFKGEEVKITSTYTYLGVQFSVPASVYDQLSSLELTRGTGP